MDNLARRQRTECELCWMLLLQIWVYLLSNFPLTITYTSMIMSSKLRTHFLYMFFYMDCMLCISAVISSTSFYIFLLDRFIDEKLHGCYRTS